MDFMVKVTLKANFGFLTSKAPKESTTDFSEKFQLVASARFTKPGKSMKICQTKSVELVMAKSLSKFSKRRTSSSSMIFLTMKENSKLFRTSLLIISKDFQSA